MLETAPRTAIILDGLDNLEEDAPELDLFMNFLKRNGSPNSEGFKTLLLSRDASFLHFQLQSQASFIIEPDDTIQGILQLVRARTRIFKHLEPCSDLIEEVVAKRSRGLFLWVEYFMSGFEGLRNINEIYDYLENTKDGLSEIYQDILQKLETRSPALTKLRKKILALTAVSFKALTLSELEEAMAVRKGVRTIDDRDRVLGGWETINAACGTILQFSNGQVELLHSSASEFILNPTKRIKFNSLPRDGEEAHEYMAAICLTYLSFEELRGSLTGNPLEDDDRQLKYPLLEYATLHWADHFIKAGNLSVSLIDILYFFIAKLSGITWAVSYFPYFKLRDGESLYSAFGMLQSQIAQVKICIRKGSIHDSKNIPRPVLLKALDNFLVRSFEKAVSLEALECGSNHLDAMERQLDLSKAYQASLDLKRAYDTASQVYQQASASPKAAALALRSHHQQVQIAMELELQKEDGSFEDICMSFQELSISLEKILGRNHKDTLRCKHDIGLTLFYDNKVVEGLKVLKAVLTQMRGHLGCHATLTQRTANNVANALYTLHELDEAEAILCSIPEVRRASRPNPLLEVETCHPYTFDSLEILALISCGKKEFDRSITLHERAMRGRGELFGQDDPTLFEFARNLGLVFQWQRRYEKAAEFYKNWLYAARKYGLEVQSRVLQQALDDHLSCWAEAVERGDLVLQDKIHGSLMKKCKDWSKRDSRSLSMGALFIILSFCYFLTR